GRFLEAAQVYGHRYGTLRDEVEPYLQAGTSVLLEIDVQGGLQIRQRCPDCVLIFIRTSTAEEYEHRLRTRRTDDPASLARRLQSALEELKIGATYDHHVTN